MLEKDSKTREAFDKTKMKVQRQEDKNYSYLQSLLYIRTKRIYRYKSIFYKYMTTYKTDMQVTKFRKKS